MWTVTGAFDAPNSDLTIHKTKLLRPGSSHALGRKDRALTIPSKKISQDHCLVTVQPFTLDDVKDPSKRPLLQVTNTGKKILKFKRPGSSSMEGVTPGNMQIIEHDDELVLTGESSIKFEWKPICCYSQAITSSALDLCSASGAHFVLAPGKHVTHHLTPTFTATKHIATSLIFGCQLVKPDWLTQLDELNGADSSEFKLPPEVKHRPAWSALLREDQKILKVWEPESERKHIFENYRFLCVGEKGREIDSDLRLLIESGGGAIEVFNNLEDPEKWRKALVRGSSKAGTQLVAVADPKNMLAVLGEKAWGELVALLARDGRQFISALAVIDAVISVDTTILTPRAEVDMDAVPDPESGLPSIVPNTIAEEPSVPPETASQSQEAPARKKLTRRVTSRQASADPSERPLVEEPQSEPQRKGPRRALTRRVKEGVPLLTGIGDTSATIEAATAALGTQSHTLPPGGRPSRLKRRVGTEAEEDDLIQGTLALIGSSSQLTAETPLERFRDLFESTDPDRAKDTQSSHMAPPNSDTQSGSGLGSLMITTQTPQTQSGTPGTAGFTQRLSALREEEEETQSSAATRVSGSSRRPLKRRLGNTEDDVEMAGVENALVNPTPPSEDRPTKKRVVDSNAVQRSAGETFESVPEDDEQEQEQEQEQALEGAATDGPKTKTKKKPGAAPGQHDTDKAFLKAIASTKKGKRTEDDFDREFNKLKISKPELEKEEPEKEWAIIDDFGSEAGLRGNFMVVLEMEVFRNKDRQSVRRGNLAHNPLWGDLPNFKKFKRGQRIQHSNKVELIVVEQDDYGTGGDHWKRNENSNKDENIAQKRRLPLGSDSQGEVAMELDEEIKDADSDEPEIIDAPIKRTATRKAPSTRAPSRAPSTRAPSTRASSVDPGKRATRTYTGRATKASQKSQLPLFLSDSEDDVVEVQADKNIVDEDDAETLATLASSAKPATAVTRKRRAPVVAAGDSDEEGVFKGFTTRKRTRR